MHSLECPHMKAKAAEEKTKAESKLINKRAKEQRERAAAREAKAQAEAAEAARKLEELKRQEADAARIVKACAEIKCRAPELAWSATPSTRRSPWYCVSRR